MLDLVNTPSPPSLIQSIQVKDLFGKRSYTVDAPQGGELGDRLILLHGDNGSGKTTLLRLIWHALSPADNRGHRSAIARIPFRELTIEMGDGATLNFKKTHELVGGFDVRVNRPGKKVRKVTYESADGVRVRSMANRYDRFDAEWLERMISEDKALIRFDAKDHTRVLAAQRAAEADYMSLLRTEVGAPLFLADDRSLYSDDPDIERTRELLSRSEEPARRDKLSRLVFLELQVTMRRVNDHLRSLALGGQTSGSANSNAIYADVLRELSSAVQLNEGSGSPASSVREQLARIAEISPGYEKFGLVPAFDATSFRELLASAEQRGDELGALASRIISPFLSSTSARYDALREAHDILEALIPTINRFLREKQLTFTPRSGLHIETHDGEPLAVEALSSGERQLVMLLCATVLARVDTRLFIIDEPELSLGVDWQRMIVDALVGLTGGTKVQFLMATHSIEIISSRAQSLVPLVAQ